MRTVVECVKIISESDTVLRVLQKMQIETLHVLKFYIRWTERRLSFRIGGRVVPLAGLYLMGERKIIAAA
jgi:hypothetical protein